MHQKRSAKQARYSAARCRNAGVTASAPLSTRAGRHSRLRARGRTTGHDVDRSALLTPATIRPHRKPLSRPIIRRIMVLPRPDPGRAARPSWCCRLGGTSLPTQRRQAALAPATHAHPPLTPATIRAHPVMGRPEIRTSGRLSRGWPDLAYHSDVGGAGSMCSGIIVAAMIDSSRDKIVARCRRVCRRPAAPPTSARYINAASEILHYIFVCVRWDIVGIGWDIVRIGWDI